MVGRDGDGAVTRASGLTPGALAYVLCQFSWQQHWFRVVSGDCARGWAASGNEK